MTDYQGAIREVPRISESFQPVNASLSLSVSLALTGYIEGVTTVPIGVLAIGEKL
jgi:hypothetical protein